MMSSVLLILSGLTLMAASGLPACLFFRGTRAGQNVTTSLFVSGSAIGFVGALAAFASGTVPSFAVPWTLPWGSFAVSVDPLSAFFLVLVFTVPALGSVYGLAYWNQKEHPGDGAKLGLFYGLLSGSMAMVVIARDSVLFLIAWEIMAISAFFAATVEDDREEVRRAGWIYLVATHLGTLILIAMFALWRGASGSFSLAPCASIPAGMAGVIFVLALIGFGFKAGLMPLHVWLPGAHANAPSHVSALMSGVMLKMGIYGIARVAGLFTGNEAWWGTLLLAAGVVSALAGITFALGQRDMKKLLAYSSIENVGIIAMGLGLALLGRASGRADLVVLGMGGALFHVWNHGLFKSLLFFCSGAVIHGSGTRDMERLGGLAKTMPATSLLFMVGAVAISALPPLNGFAGEWLLYLGFFRVLGPSGVSGLSLSGAAAAALAMTGALAAAAFVKLYGTVFLGVPRSSSPDAAHDPPFAMAFAMAVPAALSVFLGLFPAAVSGFLGKATAAWSSLDPSAPGIRELAPQTWISVAGIGLLAATAALALALRLGGRKFPARRGVTWDCGYAKPDRRMQYTGTSFAENLVRLFSFALRPRTESAEVKGHSPGKASFGTDVPDAVLDSVVLPAFRVSGGILPGVYVFQQGQTHVYVLYVLAITLALFIFSGTGAGL